MQGFNLLKIGDITRLLRHVWLFLFAKHNIQRLRSVRCLVANFQKAGRLHSRLIMLAPYFTTVFLFFVSKKHKNSSKIDESTPVCFFLLYYIYSKCMYFWVVYFTDFRWRQFSKSWTPSFLPYPCSALTYHLWLFCMYSIQKTKDGT